MGKEATCNDYYRAYVKTSPKCRRPLCELFSLERVRVPSSKVTKHKHLAVAFISILHSYWF